MHDSKLPLYKSALAFYLFPTKLRGVSGVKLHQDPGITQKSAWHMAHRTRESWDDEMMEFGGPVEVYETYVGGKEKNKHASQKLNAGWGHGRQDCGFRPQGSRDGQGVNRGCAVH